MNDMSASAAPDAATALTLADHRHLLAELDTLLAQVAELMARFEATGYDRVMRDDYLALHQMQARAWHERLVHSEALGLPAARLDPGPRH